MDHDQLNALVADALRSGADAAEAGYVERRAMSIGVRMGALEEVEREETRYLGLRVFIGRQQATVSGSDLSLSARRTLVDRALSMARLAPEDVYAGLPDSAQLQHAPRTDLDLVDPLEPSAEALEADARVAEAAGRAVSGVTSSHGGSAYWARTAWQMVNSHGFASKFEASSSGVSASVIAQQNGSMETGSEGRRARYRDDLPSAQAIGETAGQRAVSRMGARKIASTTAPVIFENRVAMSLIGPFLGAISGPAIARGQSFLKDKLDQAVFAPGITITDDPHRPRGLGSTPFDDEGVANQARALIDDGRLTTWLLNAPSSRQLGMTNTGHASRGLIGPPGVSTSNLTVLPGRQTLPELMADAKTGLLVTTMFSPSLNPDTGVWSAGCSGFWFDAGEISYPVHEITVAGHLIEIYQRLVPGFDLKIRGASNAPSLFVDQMAIAGQ